MKQALSPDASGRRQPLENWLIESLCDVYENHSGRSATKITDNPAKHPDEQFRGQSLDFLRTCLDKAGVSKHAKSDAAIAELIKRKKKREKHN